MSKPANDNSGPSPLRAIAEWIDVAESIDRSRWWRFPLLWLRSDKKQTQQERHPLDILDRPTVRRQA